MTEKQQLNLRYFIQICIKTCKWYELPEQILSIILNEEFEKSFERIRVIYVSQFEDESPKRPS